MIHVYCRQRAARFIARVLYLTAALGCSASFSDNAMTAQIKFGVLGDSDSHSFHDRVLLNEPQVRGGEFRAVTYQWTEIIARLRPQQIDMGKWGEWGMPGRLAGLLGAVGLEDRAPRKEDYRYNFALSGAKCENLTTGMSRQTQRLIYRMDREPAAWARGIVTIRIGINSIGTHDALARFAQSGLTKTAQHEVDACAAHVRESVRLIRSKHPTTRIVLIGILNNADFIPWLGDWRTPPELRHIAAVMDAYDAHLQQLAAADPNILFWDDRAWFAHYFGSRDEAGAPRYRSTRLTGPTSITYTQGDAPTNAILADNHAGTVWNGLWARDLLSALNARFGYSFKPIAESEIAALADPDGKLGIAAPR